jgi:uncharacterized protein YkwD
MKRLRSGALPVVVCIALAASTVAAASPQRHEAAPSVVDRGLIADVNAVRTEHGLTALEVSAELMSAALAHSEEMGAAGYFAHHSANGAAFWQRIRRFYPPAGAGWSVGENLLWSSPGIDVGGALAAWLASPEHRANLLAPRWRQLGVAVVRRSDAPGVYGGRTVTIVTMDFGVR